MNMPDMPDRYIHPGLESYDSGRLSASLQRENHVIKIEDTPLTMILRARLHAKRQYGNEYQPYVFHY